MGVIKNLDDYGQYEELEFDDSLWEIIDIPQKVYRSWYDLNTKPGNNYLTQTLHYVGPIVNGEIVGGVPAMDFQFHTFENCKELKEIPADFKPVNFWCPFYHCSNLNPSFDKLRDFHQITKYCSGKYHGYLLDACNSPFVVSAFSQEEFFAKWTGYELPQFAALCNWSGQKYSEVGYDFECLKKVLNTVLKQGLPLKEISLVTQGAGIFEVRQLHFTSEIPEECWNKEIVTKDFVITCSYSGAGDLRGDGEFFVGVFADDFVNDTMDAEILSVRPQTIHGSVVGPIIATEVEFDGDCVVEAEDSPVIVADGVLTLRGTGSIILRSHGMQPAVGIETHTGMSFGRWSPGSGEFSKLVVDGVSVVLESDVPNFTIGSYGVGSVPEIELRNGGTLDCPEMRGRRVMVQSGEEGLYGSTKRSKRAVYEIEYDGSDSLSGSVDSSAKPVHAFL